MINHLLYATLDTSAILRAAGQKGIAKKIKNKSQSKSNESQTPVRNGFNMISLP